MGDERLPFEVDGEETSDEHYGISYNVFECESYDLLITHGLDVFFSREEWEQGRERWKEAILQEQAAEETSSGGDAIVLV